MRAETKRMRVPTTRAIGLRKPVEPRPSPDLRVFRIVSKISRRGIRQYINGLLGPR